MTVTFPTMRPCFAAVRGPVRVQERNVQRRYKSFDLRNRNLMLRVYLFRDAPQARALEQNN